MIKCSHESQIPSEEECPNAYLQKVKNQCCDEWICDSLPASPLSSVSRPAWDGADGDALSNTLFASEIESLFTNQADRDLVYEWNGGEDGDELTEQELRFLYPAASTNNDEYTWEETNRIPDGELFGNNL